MPENDTSSGILTVQDDIAPVDFLPKEEFSEHYELLLLIAGTMTDEEAAMIVDSVKTLLADMGATMTHDAILGRRNLGYSVAKSRTGVYGLFEFDLLKKQLPAIQEKLRLRKDITRFLIIKKTVLTAEEIAENERIAKKITERRLAKKAAADVAAIAAQPIEQEVKKEVAPSEIADVAAPKPENRPKKTLEDIDKEIDRILGGDIEL